MELNSQKKAADTPGKAKLLKINEMNLSATFGAEENREPKQNSRRPAKFLLARAVIPAVNVRRSADLLQRRFISNSGK